MKQTKCMKEARAYLGDCDVAAGGEVCQLGAALQLTLGQTAQVTSVALLRLSCNCRL